MSRENILYKIHPVAFGCSSHIPIKQNKPPRVGWLVLELVT